MLHSQIDCLFNDFLFSISNANDMFVLTVSANDEERKYCWACAKVCVMRIRFLRKQKFVCLLFIEFSRQIVCRVFTFTASLYSLEFCEFLQV
jgi:hypothetical protein